MLVAGPLLVVLVAASADEIGAAHARGDLDEVGRLGALAGAATIQQMLSSNDPAQVQAGLAAAPAAPDAWELLDDLVRLAGAWDRARAAPAARTAVRIARTLDGELAILHDLPDDALEAAQEAWIAIASRGDRWGDVRVHALEVAAHVAAARSTTAAEPEAIGYDLATFLHDDDPEVRRAACELVPQPTPEPVHAPLATAVREDESAAVAVACAQALCADLAFDPAGPTLAALGDGGAARLQQLLGDRKGPPDAPAGALVDAARCLAARGTREDKAALRVLAGTAPKQARAMIRHLE